MITPQIEGLENTSLWEDTTNLGVTSWEALDSWTIKMGDDLTPSSTTVGITNPDDIEDITLVLEYAVNLGNSVIEPLP